MMTTKDFSYFSPPVEVSSAAAALRCKREFPPFSLHSAMGHVVPRGGLMQCPGDSDGGGAHCFFAKQTSNKQTNLHAGPARQA